jgi:hypothetical protein
MQTSHLKLAALRDTVNTTPPGAQAVADAKEIWPTQPKADLYQ